ncbi:MAG TPA: hypothetical protein VFW87_08615, partial [Pirellulales bacterium]|nr:hypothetical protein [Pirellulales bacterium]
MPSMESETARAASVLSELSDTAAAAREACHLVRDALGARPQLAFVFATFHHQPQFERLAEIVHSELQPACLVGCTGESIVVGP